MQNNAAERLRRNINSFSNVIGNLLVDTFHKIALFSIGGAIVWSAIVAFLGMAENGHATVDDILLLFIYLEFGAMVGIYFKTNHMPVRFLTYVAMTALTRVLITDVKTHERPEISIVMVSAALLLLALATLVIRYGSAKYPSPPTDESGT
ncbi:MAG: phosphate-starvation-inducible PsiE family protein [Nevskia sp.]|jgi:phosphate starvation-inducible membrane PsiE|nr:phosphate-starvation-inducible PsiE family protein [Nevskia sp.]MCK9385578.1 phosphate-starvation-inducible PsiE family protein [Nevskia sp.]